MKIEREIRKGHEGYDFPLSEAEIESILEKLPAKDLEGLEKIVITPPLKNEDYKNFGRYISLPGKKGKILLFIHQKENDKFIVELGYSTVTFTYEEFKQREYQVVLHEVGHHVGMKDFNDRSEDFANDYQSEHFIKHFYKLFK